MNPTPPLKIPCAIALASLALLAAQLASAGPFVWTGAGANLDWLTPENWSPAGPPGVADEAQFFNDGATNDAVSINNILSQDLSVQSLWYGQTNGVHNTLIEPGVTLTLTGAVTGNILIAGTETDNGSSQGETNTISGKGATLSIQNTSAAFIVRQESSSGGSNLRSTFDLSGLDNLSAAISRLVVGCEGAYPRPAGTLYLARTNVITAAGSAPAIAIGGNGGGNHNSGNSSYVYLGQENTINAATLTVGRVKQGGNSSISFNPAFANSTATFRGADGVSPMTTWTLADAESGSGSGDTRGIADFSAGTVDALVNTMILGREVSSHNPLGTFTFGQGTVNVNTLILGEQTQSSTYTSSGTMNVNGPGSLIVNSNLALTQTAGGTGVTGSTATLNVGGGMVKVLGTLSHGGGKENINVTNGVLELPPHSSILGNVVSVDGGVITNVDVLQASNSLAIANGGIIATPLVFDMGTSGSAQWDVSGAPGGGITVSNMLSGAGYIYGNVTMAPGSVLNVGGTGVVNPLSFNNDLALNGTTLRVDLSSSGLSGNDLVYAIGNLSVTGTNQVLISALNSALDTVNPYTLISYSSGFTGDATNFDIAGALKQSRYTFTFSTALQSTIQLLVGGSGSANLLWAGDGAANVWDLKTTANWKNGASPDKFYNLDNVIFDDSGSATPAINLTGSLEPGSITMSNGTKAYVFSGSGQFGGVALTNYGAGGLTITNQGTNSFTAMDIENGTVTLAGGNANTFDIGGVVLDSSTAFLTVANTNVNDFGPTGISLNGGTLTFDQAADATVASSISGFGVLTKENTNALTLAGNNSSFISPIDVVAGTLKVGIPSSLGLGGVLITPNGALDVNGQNLSGNSTITASGPGPDGTGAVVNSGPDQTHAFATLTLAGDTTFGGSGRWDVRGSSTTPGSLNLNSGGYNITKVGTNEVALVYTSVDPTLGNVDIQEGEFAIQTTTAALGGVGDPTKTITIHPGALLETYALGAATPLNKLIVVQTGGMIQNDNGLTVLSGAITAQGTAWVNANAPLDLTSAVGGAGGLTMIGGSTLILSAANTYSGPTVVTNGTLQVDGSLAGSRGVDVVDGTLSGTGEISAPVTIEIGGTLSPGDGGIGALTVGGNLTLSGTSLMDLDKTASVLTNDVITNLATLTLGGTLQLNITGDTALASGDSFLLYSAKSITGSFTQIIPSTPGAGLRWDTTQLSKGILGVGTAISSSPTLGSVSVSGGNLTFTVSGGSAGATFYLLTATNVAAPLSTWTPVTTNQFDSNGSFSFTNAVGAQPQQFFILRLQ